MKDINHLLDDVELQEERSLRFYLGMSQIGNPNQRLLWLRWRWLMPDDWEPRVLRLLDLGNVVEEDLIKKLRKIPGASIFDLDGDGKQLQVKALGGHLKGHLDGIAKKLPGLDPKNPYLLEFKTANDNRFNKLQNLGSYCDWSEEYAAQIHMYMGLAKLKHFIAIVYNKNNSDLYTEVIEYDKDFFDSLIDKAKNILSLDTPPDNYIPETDYRIKNYMTPIQRGAYLGRTLPPKIHCRSCRFAEVKLDGSDGTWHCNKHGRDISNDRQLKGCKNHNYIPGLIPAHCIEKDDSIVIYEKDEMRFVNVPEGKHSKEDNFYSSKELIEVINSGFPKEALEQYNKIKHLFDGKIEKIRPWVDTGAPF